MPRYKLINGEQIQLTAEEEALRDADENQEAIDQQAKINAETDKETNICKLSSKEMVVK